MLSSAAQATSVGSEGSSSRRTSCVKAEMSVKWRMNQLLRRVGGGMVVDGVGCECGWEEVGGVLWLQHHEDKEIDKERPHDMSHVSTLSRRNVPGKRKHSNDITTSVRRLNAELHFFRNAEYPCPAFRSGGLGVKPLRYQMQQWLSFAAHSVGLDEGMGVCERAGLRCTCFF